MTTAEACGLSVELTRELSAARQAAASWRIMAMVAIQWSTDLQRELEMVDARSYTWRRRMQDERDLWVDQRDLREQEAA